MKKDFKKPLQFRMLSFNAIVLLFALLLVSCSDEPKLIIALSKGSGSVHYENYSKWLKDHNKNVEIIDMINIPPEEAAKTLEKCSGIVLTGGPDVHPGRFGKESEAGRCSIDLERDTLEFALIEKALELDMPILAICRGEQILNVALGGSLIIDIPTDFDTTVTHQCEDSENCFHDINVVEGTLLHDICSEKEGMVNTNHHQAVDELAPGLIASAFTEDGLIEAFEWADHSKRPFMLAVQWHPERLEKDISFSKPIAKYFLQQSENYLELSRSRIEKVQ